MQAQQIHPEDHLGLVRKVARRYKGHYPIGSDFDDAVSVGSFGLLYAARRSAPSKGFAFSTLAVPCITTSIIGWLKRNSALRRTPPGTLLYLDAPVHDTGHDSAGYHELIGGDSDEVEAAAIANITAERVRQAVAQLPVREREIIIGVYFEGQTRRRIAAQQGMSKSSVSRIHRKAISHLRALMCKQEDEANE